MSMQIPFYIEDDPDIIDREWIGIFEQAVANYLGWA